MIKDVLVTVRGQQKTREQTGDPIELMVPGKYYKRDGEHYLSYEEVAEEAGEVTKNLIRFSGEKMELRKKGYLNSLMIFEKGKKTVTRYQTPFGSFDTGITTLDLSLKEEGRSIDLCVKYTMCIDEDFVQDSEVSIHVVFK